MSAASTETLIHERLQELNPRDTFELGIYRFLVWGGMDGSNSTHQVARLAEWACILRDLANRLDAAATR